RTQKPSIDKKSARISRITCSSSTTRMRGVSCTLCGSIKAGATFPFFVCCMKRCVNASFAVRGLLWESRSMATWPWWLPWLVYGPMGPAGAAWAYWARGAGLTVTEEARWSALQILGVWVWCLVALGFAAATVASTRLLVQHTKWARSLHMRLRGLLLGLSGSRIAMLSLLSATAEELVFRAALAPS